MEVRKALARTPIFSNLKGVALDSVGREAQLRCFAPGDLLVKEGEAPVAFFILNSGQVEVVKGLGQEEERVVAHLAEGDFFGEMSLLDGFPRSASVRAVTECDCIVLARWDFLALLRGNPEVALPILPVLCRRLRECGDQTWA